MRIMLRRCGHVDNRGEDSAIGSGAQPTMFRPKPINSPATSSFVPWKKKIRILAPVVGLALLGAAGCATPPEDDPEALAEWHEINDPIEPTNRAIFAFNLGLFRMVFRPLA